MRRRPGSTPSMSATNAARTGPALIPAGKATRGTSRLVRSTGDGARPAPSTPAPTPAYAGADGPVAGRIPPARIAIPRCDHPRSLTTGQVGEHEDRAQRLRWRITWLTCVLTPAAGALPRFTYCLHDYARAPSRSEAFCNRSVTAASSPLPLPPRRPRRWSGSPITYPWMPTRRRRPSGARLSGRSTYWHDAAPAPTGWTYRPRSSRPPTRGCRP